MTKAQRRQQKLKKQAAAEAKDAQASPKSRHKGPPTPPKQTPMRPLGSPLHSPQRDPVTSIQAANRPVPNSERVQSGEWQMDRVSRRKTQQAKRHPPSKVLSKMPDANKNLPKQQQAAERAHKKAPTKTTQRPTVRGSTALPRTAGPDMMTIQSRPKYVTKAKPIETYSSAVGHVQGIRNVVMPLVGNKAPLSELMEPYCREDHKWKQLDKLQTGASPFTAYRSVRGAPSSLLPAACYLCSMRFATAYFPALCSSHDICLVSCFHSCAEWPGSGQKGLQE